MAKLLTGYTGVNIFAADDQDLYKGIVGEESVVFSVGGELGLTVSASNNAVTATIADGAFSFNGRIVRVATAEARELTVPESGRYRKCEIVARYEKNSGTYVESVTLTPLYSSEDSDTASGAEALPISTTANDFPLYSFVYSSNGIEQSTKETLFVVTESIESLRQRIDDTDTNLSNEVTAREQAVSQEVSDRQNAISSLSGTVNSQADDIAAEVSARQALDTRVSALETTTTVFNGTASQTVSFNSTKLEFIAIIGGSSKHFQVRCRLSNEAGYNGTPFYVSFGTNQQVYFKRTTTSIPNTQIGTESSTYKIEKVYSIG